MTQCILEREEASEEASFARLSAPRTNFIALLLPLLPNTAVALATVTKGECTVVRARGCEFVLILFGRIATVRVVNGRNATVQMEGGQLSLGFKCIVWIAVIALFFLILSLANAKKGKCLRVY